METKTKKTNTTQSVTIDDKAANEAKKQALKERTKTVILYVLSWLLLYIVFDALSSKVWLGTIGQNVRLAFNFVNLILLVPILFFGVKEICDLCFPKNKKVLIAYSIVTFALYFGIGIILLLGMPFKLGIIAKAVSNNKQTAFMIYVVSLLASLVLLFLSGLITCVIKDKKHTLPNKKSIITFSGLLFLVTLFACAYYYVSVVHQWTTCLILTFLPFMADAFAYFSGMLFGKHKMCPKISPKKTWEGLIGSIIIATLIMCGIYGFFFINNAEAKYNSLYSFLGCQTCAYSNAKGLINYQPYFWAIYVCVTMLLIGVSTVGDLFYSWIKRKYGIKDFSNLLPGHGGMLDRIDSLTFVFGLYFLVTIILQLAVRTGNVNPGINVLWGF